MGNELGPSITTRNSRRRGSLQITSVVSSANEESIFHCWRTFRLATRSISETAVVVVGSLGMEEKLFICKLGHSVGKVVTIGATNPSWKFGPKLRSMEVIPGKGRGDEGNEILNDAVQLEGFQIRKQRFVECTKLQH